MDAQQAREHLEMVDRILQKADERPYRPMGGLLVAWGVGAGIMEVASQLSPTHGPTGPLAIAGIAILAASFMYTVAISFFARKTAERMPSSEARMGKVMGAVWLCIWVAAFCQANIFSGWATGAIWNLGAAIAMFISGFFGDRKALLGGIALLASIVIANFWFVYPGFVLAGGFLFGYVAVGIAYMIQNSRDPVCG